MRLNWLIFTFFFSFSAFATPLSMKDSKDCKQLRSEQIHLALLGANLENAKTTRIPEGGPYRPYVVKSCANGQCRLERDQKPPLLRYLPRHPQSNSAGYVAFPNVDVKDEYAKFAVVAAKLLSFGDRHVCGTTIVDQGSSFRLRYFERDGAKEDFFRFDKSHHLISWRRIEGNGMYGHLRFDPQGEVISKRHGRRARARGAQRP